MILFLVDIGCCFNDNEENGQPPIEHFSNSIYKVSFQIKVLNSQHADLRKVLLGLESKANSV